MAEYAARFLERVQLQGAEVPAFNAVMGWLESKTVADDEAAQ